MKKIDLHIHSNLSDGELNIYEIIDLAKKSNCNNIAITDHEKIVDYSDLNKDNFNIINGIEFNSSENRMHFLGYGIKDIKNVQNFITKLNLENEQICCELIESLYKAGYDISYSKVHHYIESVGLNCEIMDKRKIVKYLIYKGYYDKVIDVYNDLIGKGQKFYIPIKKLTPRTIIELINNNGGVSVLAHPSTLELNNKELLKKMRELVSYGLDGIEVINDKMNEEKTNFYNHLADKLSLIRTVGTDFHNPKEHSIGILYDESIFNELQDKIKVKTLNKV